MSFFDNISKTISDVGQSTIQKGKEIADVAKYNSLISDEEKKITGIYEQIGKHYVEVYGDSPENSFVEYMDALKASNNLIKEYQEKLKDLRGVSNCPTCGAEVPNGSLFCSSCGTKMMTSVNNASSEEVHCTVCGAVIPSGSKFCTSCGKSVVSEETNNA